MTNKFYIPNLRFSGAKITAGYPNTWKFLCEIDGSSIPDNLPLTDKAIILWKQYHNALGYRAFHGLKENDIRSIFSAVKRGDAVFTRNRQGNLAAYKFTGKLQKQIRLNNK